MRNYEKNKLLEVVWVDIVQDPSWLDEDKIEESECPMCKTVGYSINKQKSSSISVRRSLVVRET